MGEVQAGVAAQTRQLEGCVRVSQAGSAAGVPTEAGRSAGPRGGKRGARFYPEGQRTLGVCLFVYLLLLEYNCFTVSC